MGELTPFRPSTPVHTGGRLIVLLLDDPGVHDVHDTVDCGAHMRYGAELRGSYVGVMRGLEVRRIDSESVGKQNKIDLVKGTFTHENHEIGFMNKLHISSHISQNNHATPVTDVSATLVETMTRLVPAGGGRNTRTCRQHTSVDGCNQSDRCTIQTGRFTPYHVQYALHTLHHNS